MVTNNTDLERVVMIQHLDPSQVDEYLEAHENVPDAVSKQMDESGVKKFELFVEEEISIAYLEVEDFRCFIEEYSNNPACKEWEHKVGEYKLSGIEIDDTEIPTMDHVWSLDGLSE